MFQFIFNLVSSIKIKYIYHFYILFNAGFIWLYMLILLLANLFTIVYFKLKIFFFYT